MDADEKEARRIVDELDTHVGLDLGNWSFAIYLWRQVFELNLPDKDADKFLSVAGEYLDSTVRSRPRIIKSRLNQYRERYWPEISYLNDSRKESSHD